MTSEKTRQKVLLSTLCLLALLLTGCGEADQATQPTAKAQQPSEVQEPEESLARLETEGESFIEIIEEDDSWLARQKKQTEQIQRLRESNSALADDDPFKLSEEAIEELSRIEDLTFH